MSTLAIIAIYYVANVQAEIADEPWGRKVIKFIFLFPLFLALSMGLSLHNTIAVLQGYRGKKSPFVRTPKFDIKGIKDSFQKQNYLASKLPWSAIFEGILAVYFVAAVLIGLYLDNTIFIAFHTLLAFGYGTIFFYTVRHLKLKNS